MSKRIESRRLRVLGAMATAAAATAGLVAAPPVASGAASWPAPGVTTQLTTAASNQFDPSVSGDYVVYTTDNDILANGTEIAYQDLRGGGQVLVTDLPGDQQLSDISGDRIAYRDFHGEADVVVYSISDHTSQNLTADSTATAGNPAIDGNLVAWEDWRSGNQEIYAEDLSTGEMRRISDWPETDSNPDVSAGTIVWVRVQSGHRDIWAYDWATGTSHAVTTTEIREEADPSIDGTTVVYQAREAGEQDLYAYDLATGQEQRLPAPGMQRAASVSGRLVAFENVAAGDNVSHIGVWDLASGATTVLTAGPDSQTLTSIDGLSVVYTNNDGSQQDVYLHRLPPPPGEDTTPPVLSLPSAIEVVATGTDGATVDYTATALDDTDGVIPLACTPAPGRFPLGRTAVSCTATDAAGNASTGQFQVTVTYAWSGVLQPVNADGSSIFKAGSTVPVKFRLTGASTGIDNAVAKLLYAKTSNGIEGDVVEAATNVAASSGSTFRYDTASGQYLFNWSTKGLDRGTYLIRIDLGDTANHTVHISLK